MRRPGSIASILTLTLLLVGACGPGPGETPTGSSGASQPVASAPARTEIPFATESINPNLPGKSETGWGPIWNAVPPSYPVPDGAEAAESDHGPVSSAYTLATSVATPRAIAEFYRDALEESGFGGTGLDGPLEDGSFTVWSSNGYGCDSLVTVLPRGDESFVTVLYGAGCPFT